MMRKIRVEDIIIQKGFNAERASKKKFRECKRYFEKFEKLDKTILVDKDNVLLDNFIRYLVLLEKGIEEVEVKTVKPRIRKQTSIYVYGKHPEIDKEYVWRLPFRAEFANKIQPGCKALVNTCRGKQVIIVTRVEELSEPPTKFPIKGVLGCVI